MLNGANFPLFGFYWGKILDSFINSISADAVVADAAYYRNILFYIGVEALFFSWVSMACWVIISERMAVKCRKAFMKSLLRQDIGWFDQENQF
jgi:ATP-binding cassette, subfamily B (MDR/TAP), member 1